MNFEAVIKQHMEAKPEPWSAVGLTDGRVQGLAAYLACLWRANQRMNLVSRQTTPEELVERHLLDCLLVLPYLPKVARVADLGSGGGFPAVPFAICRPETSFALYEKSPLKRKFYAELRELAPNLEDRGLLTEDELDGKTQLVTARAFKPVKVILSLTRGYLKSGGAYMLLKGRRAKIDEELNEAAGLLKGAKVTVQAIETHGMFDERHVVWVG